MMRGLASKPEMRRRLAESSRDKLLRQRFFWVAQTDFWIAIAISIVVFLLLAPYTYVFAGGWVFLTLVIQSLAVWGGLITAKAIAKIEIETAIAGEVEFRAAACLSTIKAHPNSRIHLQQLEEDILPNNQSTPPPSMIRLFQQICKEAKDRKFESSVNLVQPYREEALDDIFRLQNIQKIALWLGILGTFIGLLRAIQVGDLSKLKEDNLMDLVSAMFENLFISFSASLAGLEVAVLLGVFLLMVRKRQENYFQVMESSAITMLSLARNAINKDEFLAEFGQVRRSMDALRDQLYSQTKQLSTHIGGLHGEVERQTGQIQVGIDKLASASQEFDGFLKNATLRHQQLIDDVKFVYDAISLRNIGTTMRETITHAGKQISDTLHPNIAKLSVEISKFNETLDKLRATLQSQSNAAGGRLDSLERQIEGFSRAQSEAANNVDTRLRDMTRKLETYSSAGLANDVKDLSSRLAALNSSLHRTGSYATPRRRGLRAFWESLRW